MFNKKEILSNLKDFLDLGLSRLAYENIVKWLIKPPYNQAEQEIISLIINKDIENLNDAFSKNIPFGTGGRRGKMGVGINRINDYTVGQSVQGFVNFLKKNNLIKNNSLVVAGDVRYNSQNFVNLSAKIISANNLKAYIYPEYRSTPQLAYTIRDLKADGGIMISASHNPASDNGIKVYLSTGGQVLSPVDKLIIAEVEDLNEFDLKSILLKSKSDLIINLDSLADDSYFKKILSLSLNSNYRQAKLVYTPLQGCGIKSVYPILQQAGFNVNQVKEQFNPDPNFSLVNGNKANPELPIVFDLALDLAKKTDSDLILANDTDADRLGVYTRKTKQKSDYEFLSGNQIAVLLLDYLIQENKRQNNDLNQYAVAKTIVTTELLTKICQKHNIEIKPDLPVGFKYIGNYINNLKTKKFLFGAEESFGYLYSDYIQEKDGAIAGLLISEYASYLKQSNKTLYEQLVDIYKEYGYFSEKLKSVYYYGSDGLEKQNKIMLYLRQKGLKLKSIASQKIIAVFDQLNSVMFFQNQETKQIANQFKDNALVFYFDDGLINKVVVRPSGTEPKIKFYVLWSVDFAYDQTFNIFKSKIDSQVEDILNDIVDLCSSLT